MTESTPEAAPTRGQGLLCPVCRIDLVMADRQGIEIDYCPQCRGVWLDRGELDKIIERSAVYERGSEPSDLASPQHDHPRREGYSHSAHGGSFYDEGHQGGGHGGSGYPGGGHGGHGQRGFLGGLFDRH